MTFSYSKRDITIIKRNKSKYNGDFYCLNCLHCFRTKNKLESHGKACENKDFYNVIMLSQDTKILEFNQNQNMINNQLSFMHILSV